MMAEINAKYAKTLFVSDLDGTLLNEHSVVSPSSARLLRQAIERGAHFTIATARTPATVDALMREVGCTLPYVVLAGAALWHQQSQRFTHRMAISADCLGTIMRICEGKGLRPFIYHASETKIFAWHTDSLSPTEQTFVAERVGTPYKEFILGGTDSIAHPAVLMICFDDFSTLCQAADSIRQALPTHEVMCYRDLFDSEKGFLEVYAPGATKAAAVQRIASQIEATSIVAFGDNVNDIPMLRAANTAIAVENAVPQALAVAHETIGSNRHDSVAKWIFSKTETL